MNSVTRLGARILIRRTAVGIPRLCAVPPATSSRPVAACCRLLSSALKKDDLIDVHVEDTRYDDSTKASSATEEKVLAQESSSCGSVDIDSDDEMEMEEMFVDPHDSFEHKNVREWGGPRRGGRLPEPTRFGDWERKGRCTDF